MSLTLPAIQRYLDQSGYSFEIMECDPELADTEVFCKHYNIAPEISANTILVKSKTGEEKFAVCVLLAVHRLNVNHTVRKKLGARKVSFASAEDTRRLTSMEIGGVTPIALPDNLPIWVDDKVMQCEEVILGGGNRSSKLRVDTKLFQSLPHAEIVSGLTID
ncbi:MAG: hypothetical protein KTR32_36520 [Granulosicoccus sp.]|nr:hypothetical protein [Granulosicoccus sp.]